MDPGARLSPVRRCVESDTVECSWCSESGVEGERGQGFYVAGSHHGSEAQGTCLKVVSAFHI